MKVKVAMNNLRKLDTAGRIMETDEGKAATTPCSWCSRPGNEVDCRVWKDKEDKSCAYCRRKGKAGCTAGSAVRPVTVKEKITFKVLKDSIALLEARTGSLEEDNQRYHQRYRQIKSNIRAFKSNIRALRQKSMSAEEELKAIWNFLNEPESVADDMDTE